MKHKMKLELDALVVESFATGDEVSLRGTVLAHGTVACSNNCDTVNATCDGAATCVGEYTCDGAVNTCRLSCGACTTERCGEGESNLTGLGCQSGMGTCNCSMPCG